MTDKKQIGQIFTPEFLVKGILDTADYIGANIVGKHVIDNSCGDGAFLCEIVRRYIDICDQDNVKQHLETYIHGIEIDETAYNQCLENLNNIATEKGIEDVNWDIRNADTLTIDEYDSKMDFVVGNPPYVRVHNLENYDAVKKFKFAEGGMTDLYLVFFEIGFNMLKQGGKLCYITPSSWINSVAGGVLRQYIATHHNLVKLIDLGHFQAFEATTYTMISLFEKDVRHEIFEYQKYGDNNSEKLKIEETLIGNTMYLSDKKTLKELRDIYTTVYKQYVQVKNGFATLADSVFIGEKFPFEKYLIPTIKASTGKWYMAFYPYDKNGKPQPKERIFSDVKISDYLENHKNELLKGKTETENPDWYLYGRTQALKDVWSQKYTVNTILKDVKSIKINAVPSGSGVYSGLYILTSVSKDILTQVLCNQDFINYVSVLKKYKSGGYYTFNSKELEAYLNYKLSNFFNDKSYVKQQRLFEGSI